MISGTPITRIPLAGVSTAATNAATICLSVEWIATQSPQARGRIERLFGTLQDRLVKEMRVSQITTIE